MKATGGIVKIKEGHIIGNESCTHCVPFPDPDYTIDVGLMNPNIIVSPISYDLTEEEIKELIEKIRRQVKSQCE